MSRQCFFRCLLDSHAPIKLLHNVETVVGRNKITKIRDQACSRQQITLKADCEECIVEVKQLGVNPSGLDGFALKKDVVYKVKHGSKIEVLVNNYFHVIEFDPPPDCLDKQIPTKRKFEEESTLSRKRILQKPNMGKASNIITEAAQNVWENIDKGEVYVFTAKGVKSSTKIAAFDMDGTLIKTKSSKVHAVDTNDWQIIFPQVAPKLKEYLDNGFKLVILSNQAPIGNGRVKIEDFKMKIESIVEKLNVPIQVYIATGKSFYRKPTTGMWKVLTEQNNDGLEVDMDESFYCGDAAGRVANWAPGKKKDHSFADRLMAENLGLKFYTPEQFFLGHSISNIPMAQPEFIPKDIKAEPFNDSLIGGEKEILVLVGYPGSGKSFIANQIEKKSGYRYRTVCRDVLGSWQKCAAEAKKLLEQGKSVIVDSTNPDKESRGRWVFLAGEMRVSSRCAKMTTTKAHAHHNNKFRELMKFKHVPVNDIVFHTFKRFNTSLFSKTYKTESVVAMDHHAASWKSVGIQPLWDTLPPLKLLGEIVNKFTEPTTAEGFAEVIQVKFSPVFEDIEAEAVYRMYLLEK